MARDFDDTLDQYLRNDEAVATAAPFTVSLWANADEYGAGPCLFCLGNSVSAFTWEVYINSSGYPALFVNAGARAASSLQISTGVWYHICGVERASDDRSTFVNGGNEGTNTDDLTLTGQDRTVIAAEYTSGSPDYHFNGRVAHVAFWDIALSDSEVAALAAGADPRTVHPQNLVYYVPLVATDQDIVGGYDMTPYNSPTWADQPGKVFGVAPPHILPTTDIDKGGARLFDDDSSQYLAVDSTPVTAAPLTMACWFKTDDITARQTLMHIVDRSAPSDWFLMEFYGDLAGDYIGAWARREGGSESLAYSTVGISADTWTHCCNVYYASDDRSAFVNGGGEGNNVVDRAPLGIDSVSIGATYDSSPGSYTSGSIAHAAIWNVALTDSEVAALAAGADPRTIRPQNLVSYWPLVRDDNDIVGGYHMTPYNFPVYDDAPGKLMRATPPHILPTTDVDKGGARLFDDDSSQYLGIDSAPVIAAPFTMSCFFKSDLANDRQALMWIGDKDHTSEYWGLVLNESYGDGVVSLRTVTAGGNGVASATTPYSLSTWHHACAVETSASARAAFIDGGNKGTDATSRAPANADRFDIARSGTSSPHAYLSGLIAHAAIWNIDLTDSEVAALAAGADPRTIRPQNLVSYWPLVRDDNDIVGGYHMIPYNFPVYDDGAGKVFRATPPHVVQAVSSITVGSTVWGHDTGVLEANVHDFSGNWTGTGEIVNPGVADTERLELAAGEEMISEVVDTGTVDILIDYNVYDVGDNINLDYRHGNTVSACEAAGWNDYTIPFTSLGYVQIKVTSTL